MQRRRVVLLVLAMVLWQPSMPAAHAASDRLPDLGMAPLSDISISKTSDGRRLLKFSTTIVNVGAGAFELRASRSGTSAAWSVAQRIYDDAAGHRDVTTGTQLVLGGDGHSHWHILNLESAELIRLDNGSKAGTGAKRGFCFWDTTAYRLSLPRAPSSAVYGSSGCGSAGSLSLTMGVSVGWGDKYSATLPDQNVDITGLTAGRYRLQVTADTGGAFAESNESNNTTWVDLQIKAQGPPKIVGYGPAA